MTAQFPESLIYEGQALAMCSTPLSDYFRLTRHHPPFSMNCTALWRGYVGSWEVVDKRLYLVGISGSYEDGQTVTLESIFPGYSDRVFAHWFNGQVRIPQGKLLAYRHMGFGSQYERDLLIDFDRGVVTQTRVRQNGVANSNATSEGYGVGGFSVFPSTTNRSNEP